MVKVGQSHTNENGERQYPRQAKEKAPALQDMGDVSRGSNPFIYMFCALILNCLLLDGDVWYSKLKSL